MAAGLGFKTFNTGDVLSAADVNGYLMQGVLVFADATARDAAITSPQEGQFAYTKDTNGLWYYSGSAWVASGATGDIEGVTAGTGISGGGTSGTVTITNDMATTITASGDIVVGTGSGTYDNLPIGTTGQILTADTTVSPYKVKWATPAGGGGMTLINTGGTDLSGVSGVTISSIPTTYTHLCIVVKNVVLTSGVDALYFRPNNDSNTNYSYQNIRAEHSTYTGAVGYTVTGEVDFAYPLSTNTATKKKCNGVCWMYRYNDTDSVFFDWSFWNFNNSANVPQGTAGTGYWTGGGGVTSLRFVTGGTFSAGTVYVYGVN